MGEQGNAMIGVGTIIRDRAILMLFETRLY